MVTDARSCCSGLDARGRRERLINLSLRSNPLQSIFLVTVDMLLLQRARRAWSARALMFELINLSLRDKPHFTFTILNLKLEMLLSRMMDFIFRTPPLQPEIDDGDDRQKLH
jgi:hypothetical protein